MSRETEKGSKEIQDSDKIQGHQHATPTPHGPSGSGFPWCNPAAHTNPPKAPSPWLSSFQHWHGKDTSLTHTPQSPHQNSEMASHPPLPTPKGLSGVNMEGSYELVHSPVTFSTRRTSHSGQQTKLLCPAMPILPTWASSEWKGRKDNWTHFFSPSKYATITHYLYRNHLLVIWSSHSQAPWLDLNLISFYIWAFNTLMIITDHQCQNQNLNSGAGVGPGSAESLRVDALLPMNPG